MRALVTAVSAMPFQLPAACGRDQRRRGPARQRHRDQTIILGAAFDDVVLYQDAAQRSRAMAKS
jgi:cyanophycin synthetase